VSRFGPRSVPTDLRRDHILTVATIAFLNDGFDRVSMDRVAGAAGVTKPVVYALFSSKEELFAAVVDQASAEMADSIAVATSEHDSPLAGGIRAFLSYAREHAGLWGPIFGSIQHSAVNDAAKRLQRQQVDIVAASIRRGHLNAGVVAGDREVEALAHLIAGAVQSVGQWWGDHPEMPLDDVVDFLEAAIAPALAAIRSNRSGTTWFDGGTE
jgi:AcrR family transcriptional regulator